MTNKPSYSCVVPYKMVSRPHMIHLNGLLVQPGKENDYTIQFIQNEYKEAVIHWWVSIDDLPEKLVSITRLEDGARWAYSSKWGVYVDTERLNREI
jgi:hypothetical protein